MEWIKASFSGQNTCVEIARVSGGVAVRNSKDPNGPSLHFTRDEFRAFLAGAKDGQFDEVAE